MSTASLTAPMLMITKPGTTLMHNVADLHDRNANTVKLASPMPDIDGIVRRVARHHFCSVADRKEFFEQICVLHQAEFDATELSCA
jgi:hypothetical protein